MAAIKVPQERDMSKNRRVMGIDSSSLGIAWTLLENGIMVEQGKIRLDKVKLLTDKLHAGANELSSLIKDKHPDHVFVEKSIFVRNPATARTLSYIVGMIITISLMNGVPVIDIEPSVWKSFLGYKNLSSAFVVECKKKMGVTEGKKFCDRLRKSQTWRVVAHNYPCQAGGSLAESDHDISDSWGIALKGYDMVGRELTIVSREDIIFDLLEFDKWNLRPPGRK